jgi:tRNA-splicing ligase RtcB
MLARTARVIGKYAGGAPDWSQLINRNHNHAVLRDGLWIHRKGATHAEEGMMGVIPGNMRDGSFIVRGKGNPDSLYSSSHGAGRVLGRRAAKETLSLDAFQNTMKGVTATVTEDTLDEAPYAYKNIFDVMDAQRELVDVVHRVVPVINIKGVDSVRRDRKWKKSRRDHLENEKGR